MALYFFILLPILIVVAFSTFISLVIFVISRFTKCPPTSKSDTETSEVLEDPEAFANSGTAETTSKTQNTLAQSLIHYLIEEKAYLNPDLDINMIANELHTNRSYVSMIINQNLGKNLKTIVAEYRIQYAKTLLLENPEMTLERVAFLSGFRSDAQFVKKFKELEGLTPRQWATKESYK